LDHLMVAQPESSTHEVLADLIERLTYHNAENGFCVLRAKARGHRDVVTAPPAEAPSQNLCNPPAEAGAVCRGLFAIGRATEFNTRSTL
jgi:hypothetical protein